MDQKRAGSCFWWFGEEDKSVIQVKKLITDFHCALHCRRTAHPLNCERAKSRAISNLTPEAISHSKFIWNNHEEQHFASRHRIVLKHIFPAPFLIAWSIATDCSSTLQDQIGPRSCSDHLIYADESCSIFSVLCTSPLKQPTACHLLQCAYSRILEITPAPTVLPPSRIAKFMPCTHSHATEMYVDPRHHVAKSREKTIKNIYTQDRKLSQKRIYTCMCAYTCSGVLSVESLRHMLVKKLNSS